MKGLFCLCLLSLLFFSFVGCEKEEPQTADTSSVVSDFLDDSELDNAYQIVKDVVVLNPKADGGVVMERHKALNWLIQDVDWDDVDIST
ncbi:MAG: DUF4272 domain-containing protein [Clostridia bacterium]|nr:DUF4272 domain-containing protein [Clostridia bacterium]